MKKILLMTIVQLALAGCATSGAEDHAHAGASGPGGNTRGQMAMMQDNMLRMHEQMHKIRDAKDPAERARLMKEHQDLMREHMKMMHGGSGGMMGAPAAR